MTKSNRRHLEAPSPDLQISFFFRLAEIRDVYLSEALTAAVAGADIPALDDELADFADPDALRKLASEGIRGEVFFPVPLLLEADPYLLGYYRLLYGASRKEFYNRGDFGAFQRFEDMGEIPPARAGEIGDLCRTLSRTAARLVLALDTVSLQTVHELQLLTVGPQFRGSENVHIGQKAIREVYALMKRVVDDKNVVEQTAKTLLVRNAAGRPVLIQFASDPDVRITEKMKSMTRKIVSIEIKGGRDTSNIHNRLGEAEKSHQKAKKQGFFEFWTIIRDDIDPDIFSAESPTTNRFFSLDRICNTRTKEHREFRDILLSITGVES